MSYAFGLFRRDLFGVKGKHMKDLFGCYRQLLGILFNSRDYDLTAEEIYLKKYLGWHPLLYTIIITNSYLSIGDSVNH